MKQKLILEIDSEVIKAAKKHAKRKEQTLSEIIERFLTVLSNINKKNKQLSPRVKKLKGAIKLSHNFEYKNELSNAIITKASA
jgi:hypothetical protein